jgi:Uncharacterised protein conserved in bacteria (DUF2326)
LPDLFPNAPFSVKPEPGRTEPRLWVKRFCIWSEPGVLVREIDLREGLNIIWSPDSRDGNGPIGHGAGKTTFCRLLRYCLGEETFGSRDQRSRIHAVLPKGQIGAEIMLDGKQWAVLRSISGRTRDIAIQGITLEQAQSSDTPATMEPLVAAIQDQILAGVATLMPPNVAASEVWQAALAWLSRDQECRFGHVLEWRHSTTESLSPVRDLSKEHTLQIVRAIIGAITSEELLVQRESDAAGSEFDKKSTQIDRLDWQIQRAQIQLGAAFGTDLITGIGPLDMVAIEEKIKEGFPGLSQLQANALREKKRKASAERERAQESLATLRSDLRVIETEMASTKELLATYKGQLARDNRGVVLAEHSPCPVCEVPLNAVLDRGCPCTANTGYLEEVRLRRKETLTKVEELTSTLASKKDQLKGLIARVSTADLHLLESREAEDRAEQEQDRLFGASREGDRLLGKAKELETLIAERTEAITQGSSGKKLHEEREGQIRLIRQKNESAVRRLSQLFDAVIRELVPGVIEGNVLIDGKGITLKVSQGGERSTAAIDSLKVVAFDIAALLLAVEGAAHLPAFLLHDSPREADLGQSIYDRLFRFIQSLENKAHFQYIVTTTTEPPSDLGREPWLRATLRGGPAKDRLMASDL